MSRGMKHFRCEVNTPDGAVFEQDVRSVNLPALDGYMGILPNRAPLTAVLATGVITIEPVGGETRKLFVSHGFCRVCQNHMSILAEECKPVFLIVSRQKSRGWWNFFVFSGLKTRHAC